MASADDLKNFIENLLAGYDPTIDLSPGSPAETQIVQPILDRFADDPFSVDIPTFVRDRFLQEFPDLAADNGGQLEDLLTNPLQLILEPFKREIESVKNNQSTINADIMADSEADALGANFFEPREEGDFSGGAVRLYFAAPVTVNVTTDKRTYTNSGLNFFPVENFRITTAQMLFNRQGNLYFMDITVQAENPGDEYNVGASEIANIDDVPGVVKVANLSAFTDGAPREDNATYLGRIPDALTERSLVTERGIEARVPNLFTSVRALSIIGAGDPGMDRDILKGTSEGFLHLAGSAAYYGEWLVISSLIYRDAGPNGDVVIQAGDLVRFKPSAGTTVYEAEVSVVVPATTLTGSTEYILILDRSLPITSPTSGSFALFKSGFITVSEVPGGIAADIQVPDGTVHLGGHSDVFVRPNSDTTQQDSLPNITDDDPVLAIAGDAVADLRISGSSGSPTNVAVSVGTSAINFVTAGVKAGDIIVIETSALAGSYRILDVGDPTNQSLRLDTLFTQTQTQLRARIVRNIHIDLVEPKIPKLPFNTGSVSDLSTTVGSNLFRTSSVNLQSFGAVVGDTIRLLDGPDAGDFTITGFDTILGGQGPIVDRAAGASTANLRYEVFTPSPGLTRPLVRIKTIEILDSTNQGTGITVPYGDAVDIRPTCNFQGAEKEIRVLDKHIFVLPDGSGTLSGLSNLAASPGAGSDARYSQEIESFDGIYRAINTQNGSNPITANEINLPPFLYNGVRNKLLAFTTRKDPSFTAFAGNNRTSDVAKGKIGDSLTILDGPNQGSYIITDLRVLDMWSVTDAGHQEIAIVEVDPPLPVDPVKTMMNLIASVTPGSALTGADVLRIFSYATDFFNASGFWALLQTRLQAAMLALAITISNQDLDALAKSLSFTGYSVGQSARGTLRCYFQEPVSAEFSSGDNPTRFVDLLQPSRVFRLDPNLPDAQILPESETTTPPAQWNRNAAAQWFDNGDPADENGFLSTGSAFVKRGIQNGDVFEFYPAINDLPARDQMQSSWVCVTQAGSNVVTAILPAMPGHRTAIEAGQLFFIDTGPDIGAYTITEVITDELGGGTNPDRPIVRFRIDKTMTHSTLGVPGDSATTARPAMPNDFSTGIAQTTSSQSRLHHDDMVNAVPNSDWISIYAVNNTQVEKYGDDIAYLGTFAVIAVANNGSGDFWAVLDRAPNFPDASTSPAGAFPTSADVFWIIHQAPTTSPTTTSGGGETLSDQFVRCRFYDSVPETRVVEIPWSSGNPLVDHTPDVLPSDPAYLLSQEQVVFRDEEDNLDPISDSGDFLAITDQSFYNHQVPYRVRRAGVHKISSTAMAEQREGALYYVDLPAIGYGPQSEMNIPENTALAIKENAKIDGYQLAVENNIFTFSDQEQVSIIVPPSILPVGSTPGITNEIDLAGQTIQITYDNAPLVEELQRFFNSPLDRVVAANYLLRHFLPAYVFLDAAYVGGSATGVVSADLIKYINSIPPATNQLVASQVENLIVRRGASQVTLPITLIALVHDIDRKIRGLRSENVVGAGDVPIFNGTYAQTYFIAGPDTSLTQPRPNGEQVFLTRT